MDTVRTDWQKFGGTASAYSDAAQDILSILDSVSTTSGTISAAAGALDTLLLSAVGFSRSGIDTIGGNQPNLVRAMNILDPTTALLMKYSPTYTCLFQGAQWFLENGGTDIARHFVGATTNLQAAAAFGIATTFGFWDWVGGRYSLWSAIGLPIAIAVGSEHFRALLAGAHAMDRHFATAPLEVNLPVQLGLLDVWYRNFHRFSSRSVAPYHQGLKRLPAYLQQLEMESNGKCVDLDGAPLPFGTSPVV